MTTVAMVWLLWFGAGNQQIAVGSIASEAACHELAKAMNRHERILPSSYLCIPYPQK